MWQYLSWCSFVTNQRHFLVFPLIPCPTFVQSHGGKKLGTSCYGTQTKIIQAANNCANEHLFLKVKLTQRSFFLFPQ